MLFLSVVTAPLYLMGDAGSQSSAKYLLSTIAAVGFT